MKILADVFLAIVIVAGLMGAPQIAPQMAVDSAPQQANAYGCTVAATEDGGFVLQCERELAGAAYICAPSGDGNAFAVDCRPALAPTATPVPATATPLPITATPAPIGYDDMHWHVPAAHGDRPFHEHGDAPPAWLTAAGYDPMFTHQGGTVGENVPYWKHTGFKGYAGTFSGQQWYAILHQDFNPAGRASRFHSYQLWIRDPSGAVSHISGWNDFGVGNNAGPQIVETCGRDSNVRPIMLVTLPGCQVRFENWYGATYGLVDWGQNINPNYFSGGDPADPDTWLNTGYVRNGERRVEFAVYASRFPERGTFWTDQFGRRVTGPTDAKCGTSFAVGGKTYPLLCIEQTVQRTMREIKFPDNSMQRDWTVPGLQFPN